MPFNVPTLAELTSRAQSDLETRLAGADVRFRRSVEYVIARAIAGSTYLLHRHLRWVTDQIFPGTADGVNLLRLAELYNVPRNPATRAKGPIQVTFTGIAALPAGTTFIRDPLDPDDDPIEYTVDNGYTALGAGDVLINVTAVKAGADGNTTGGETISLQTPIANITSDAISLASTPIDGGADIETIDALRVRLSERLQDPPDGGGPNDYVAWAKEVSGVTRAWEVAQALGPGTVQVFFVRDDDSNLIPSVSEVAEVQAYIDAVAPVTAAVTVTAPASVSQNFSLAVKVADGYTLSEVKTNIEAELTDLLKAEGGPAKTIRLSQFREAISAALGESYHTMTSPAADVTYGAAEVPVLGSVVVAEL